MDISQKFGEAVIKNSHHTFDLPAWERSKKAYDDKKNAESLGALISYIHPGLKFDFFQETCQYSINHGSMKLNLVKTGKRIEITAPFLKIPTPVPVALLRQVMEINFYEMMIPQITLQGDVLTIKAAFDLDQYNPYYVYDMFHNICFIGDFYDDLFVDKFKAERIFQPQTSSVPSETVQKAYAAFQEICTETLAYVKSFEEKRWAYTLDHMWVGLFKLKRALKPEGLLKSEIERMFAELSAEKAPEAKLEYGKKMFEKFMAYPVEKFATFLESSELFISGRRLIKPEHIGEFFKRYLKGAEAERAQGDYIGSSLGLMIGYYRYFNMHVGEMSIDVMLESALRSACGKPWRECSDILFNNLANVEQIAMAMTQAQSMMSQFGGGMDLNAMSKAVTNG